MHLRYLGYACQNVSIPCTTGRTTRLSHLTEETAAEKTRLNLEGLMRILRWNLEHGIRFFRISSSVVPFASHPAFPLDWRRRFEDELEQIRAFADEHAMRLTMHPGQYTVLNSPKSEVVERAINELDYHARFLEAVDPEEGTMTLHVGGAYGDMEAAVERFEQNFERLSASAQARLALENDDTTYHVHDVLALCRRLGTPLIFDYFHHRCHHPGTGPEEGLADVLPEVVETWEGRVPKLHLSSRREGTRTSHADLLEQEDFDEFAGLMANVQGGAYDLMVEAKRKDEAVLALRVPNA